MNLLLSGIFALEYISLSFSNYFRVYNDSTVRYSKRVNFDIACQMKFHKFPKDEQVCIIKFESFSYSTDQMNMKWLDESLSQVSSEFDSFLYCKIKFSGQPRYSPWSILSQSWVPWQLQHWWLWHQLSRPHNEDSFEEKYWLSSHADICAFLTICYTG